MSITPLNDLVRDVRTDGTQHVTGKADIYYSADVKEPLVHGTDTLTPIANIADKILETGEKISELQRVTWRRMMRHSLIVRVANANSNIQVASAEDCCDGSFLTSKGRTLNFAAKPDLAYPVSATRNSNSIANMLASCDRTRCIDTDVFATALVTPPVTQLLPELQGLFDRTPGLAIGTFSEIVDLGVVNSMWKAIALLGKNPSSLVMVGMNTVQIPSDAKEALKNGVEMNTTIEMNRYRRSKSGHILIPYTCRTNFQKNPATGLLAMK